MTDEPREEQLREGIFDKLLLPDFEKISREWQALLEEKSAVWEAKVDDLARQLQEAIVELKSIQGVTVVVNRSDGDI